MVRIADPIPASRPSPNAAKTQVVPIVLVPGLMGTRLSFEKPDGFDKALEWDPDSDLDMWQWLDLTPTKKRLVLHIRNRATLTGGDNKNGWEALVGSAYGKFRTALLAKKPPAGATTAIYAAGYDWRQTCALSAQRLAARVAAILKANKGAQQVILITHSMGGLVARGAMGSFAGLANSVRGVVHVAQPVAGAVALYRRIFTGMLTPSDGDPLDGDENTGKVLGNTPQAFTLPMSGMPGVFELLPTQQYRYIPDDSPDSQEHPEIRLLRGPWESIDEGERDSFGRIVYSPGVSDRYLDADSPPGIFNARLHGTKDPHETAEVQRDIRTGVYSAKAFHEIVGLKMHTETRMIYSTGLKTDVAVKYPVARHKFDHHFRYRKTEGDGTVPEASASALWPSSVTASVANARVPANRQFVVQGAEHGKILDNSTVQQVIFELIDRMIKNS